MTAGVFYVSIDDDRVDGIGSRLYDLLTLCLGRRLAADGDRAAVLGSDHGTAQIDERQGMLFIIDRVIIKMDGHGIGDIEAHRRAFTVSKHRDRSAVEILLIHRQRTRADDIEAGVMEVEIIVDINDAERTIPDDIHLEIVAHVPDEQLVVRSVQVVDRQRVGRQIIGHALDGTVIDHDFLLIIIIIQCVVVIFGRCVKDTDSRAAVHKRLLRGA